MAGELEAVVRGMFDSLDRKDLEAMTRHFARDPQAIDEISRRWLRGREQVDEYLGGLLPMVEDVRSEIHDLRETMLGETGIVTCWLEQDYTLAGERHHISAPTTAVLGREDGKWRMTLFHSIPLPPGEES
jgi:uncharacterized protein (TIGR02246 family)